MRSNTWMLIGAFAIAAGVLMPGKAYGTSGVVHAANGQIPCDATATPIQGIGQIQAFQAAPECTATPTTPRKLSTHADRDADGAIEDRHPRRRPNTPAPTNTPKAASEGVAVKPPNTGSGNGASGDSMTLWLLGLGGIAAALGGGRARRGGTPPLAPLQDDAPIREETP